MERVLNPNAEDAVFRPNMIISGLDLIWEGVVWNDENLKVFVKRGGVYDLLDIIQVSTESLYPDAFYTSVNFGLEMIDLEFVLVAVDTVSKNDGFECPG